MTETFEYRLIKVLDEVQDLMIRKRKDYGYSNILELGREGVLGRINDKRNRLIGIVGGHKPLCEAADDSWLDIIGYGLIGLLLQRGQWYVPVEDEPDDHKPESTVRQNEFVSTLRPVRLVYLAGPIDLVNGQVLNWRLAAKRTLKDYGISSFDPSGAFCWNGGPHQVMMAILDEATKNADAMLVHLDPNVLAIGTVLELFDFVKTGKPVVIWGPTQLYRSVYLISLGVPILSDLGDACKALAAFNVEPSSGRTE